MKLLSSLLVLLVGTASALFQRDAGINDWKHESLGDLTDLKFLESTNLAYTLSTSGLLTLFDTEAKGIIWKKEMPAGEDFKLRYLSRNLLAVSQKRALLINSASHIIYDVPFDSLMQQTDANVVTEFFELKGNVYAVFAKGDRIAIYKDYQQVAILEYKAAKSLELIFDRKTETLVFLVLQEDQ